MSSAPPENVNITEADIGPGAGDHQYPPQLAHNQASQAESSFVDSSGPIFSMYLEMAEEEDRKLAESWKADAEGILIFTGLFSAAVASLISVSIQDIRQNPQDTSNFYLANIYQAIADPNRPNISSSLPASPPPFTPPAYAVWVNSLWFLSLVISITCALLATFLQQWTRRYLKVTQTRYSLHKRARIRSFFAEGVEKSTLPLVVEALPMLLHVSLSLFFAGLVVFLWNVNLTIFKVVLSWISVCTALYGCFTLIPVFRHDSPYYTPITEFAGLVMSLILLGFFILCVVLDFLFFLCSCCFCCRAPARIFGYLTNWFNQVLDMTLLTPKKAALKVSSEIDTRALMWTFDRLDEDHELELFFSGLPGFHNSKVVKEPLHGLSSSQQLELLTGLIGLLDRTYSSNLLADGVKRHREDICTNAINLVHAPKALPNILRRLASEDEYGPVQSTEIVHFVRRWGNRNEYTTLDQAIFSVIVARVQQHDNSWFNLASHELGVTEPVLRKHATHRDTLSLTILIYVIRQQLIHFRNPSWPSDAIAEVIRTASKFKVQDTSPELQHELCALWNQIVRKAQNDGDWKITKCILNPIRKVYISLHQDSESSPIRFSASAGDGDPVLDNPSSYPVCNIAGHILDESASTTFSRNVLRDDAALSPASPPSPDTPSLSVPAPLHVDKSLTTVPPLDDSHPTQQTVDSLRAPVTTPDPASAEAVQDIVDTGITSPTPEAYTFAPPLSSTSPSAAVSLLNNSDPLMPSDSPNLPSFASDPVLEDTLPTESHPGPSSAPDVGAVSENNGSLKPGLHKEQDVLAPPSVNRSIHPNTMATLDLPLQSPALPSITDSDVAIAGRSLREPNAEHTADRPPDRSCYQYDMV